VLGRSNPCGLEPRHGEKSRSRSRRPRGLPISFLLRAGDFASQGLSAGEARFPDLNSGNWPVTEVVITRWIVWVPCHSAAATLASTLDRQKRTVRPIAQQATFQLHRLSPLPLANNSRTLGRCSTKEFGSCCEGSHPLSSTSHGAGDTPGVSIYPGPQPGSIASSMIPLRDEEIAAHYRGDYQRVFSPSTSLEIKRSESARMVFIATKRARPLTGWSAARNFDTTVCR